MSARPFIRSGSRRLNDDQGSLLIVTLLIAAAIAIGLVGYLNLGRTSLKLAHRTFFAHDAVNLAEAGLEETLYSFNLMGSGTAVATAWTGWTISGTNATRTFSFDRNQNAVGTVKVYVHGYDGSDPTPYAISQASIAPFDGSAPIVKLLQIKLKKNGTLAYGVVGRTGLTWGNQVYGDSFNSNPTNSPTGPWAAYPGTGATARTLVIVAAGSIALNNQSNIKGNLSLGSGVTAPAASKVSGTIQTNFTGTFLLPTYPTAASVSQSYNLGSTIPALLPAVGHVAASDGRYYYFCSGANIAATTIKTGTQVILVGSGNTRLTAGLVVQANATCIIYMNGTITTSNNTNINGANWAGALQIYTSSSGTCSFSNNSRINACLFAPNARINATSNSVLTGSFVAKTITAANNACFHYDEALGAAGGGNAWALTSWFELQSSADRSTVGTLTNNFLP